MFNNGDHYSIWERLKKLAAAGHRAEFTQLLKTSLPMLEAHLDDLRMLFYIGTHCDAWAHASALAILEDSPTIFAESNLDRLSTYRYAISQACKNYTLQNHDYLLHEFDAALVRKDISLPR